MSRKRRGTLGAPPVATLVSLAALIAIGVLSLPTGVKAQAALTGRVLDAQSMAPVRGAFVGPVESNQGVLTDSVGVFVLPVGAAGIVTVRVVQLGYHALSARLEVQQGGMLPTIMLVPNPVELDGLTVLTEQFAERRRGPYGVGQFLDQEQLRASSDGTGFELIRRLLPFVTPCGPDTEALCTGGRSVMGQRRRVAVCLDDRTVHAPMMETLLSTIDPRSLYMVEAYSRVGEVRLYSPGYMKRLLETGQELPPLRFGCTGTP